MYHKFDEDRIRDSKEDIDTLLVFVSEVKIDYFLRIDDTFPVRTGRFVLCSAIRIRY